jgi:hypothetical protein
LGYSQNFTLFPFKIIIKKKEITIPKETSEVEKVGRGRISNMYKIKLQF